MGKALGTVKELTAHKEIRCTLRSGRSTSCSQNGAYSYADSAIGCVFGQRNMNVTGDGQAEGWISHSLECDCPVDNETGEIIIICEYGAFAFLGVNGSGSAYAKLWLTFFIDDIER